MSEVMFSDKTFDGTITAIANKFIKEFYLKSPPFVTLINSTTQCFHYYGKRYYNNVINNFPSMKDRIPDVINKVLDVINKDDYMKRWYTKTLNEKTIEYLNNRLTLTHGNNSIDLFLDLLLNTPISLNYGVVGQIYHTRVPGFFYSADIFNKYSGVKKFIREDLILESNQSAFKIIIDILEEVFWKDFIIGSAIVAPIVLFGQIAGVAFVSDCEDGKFNYYDYLRFLQLTKELSITLIKDAKQYEFISDVIKCLPDKNFDIVIAVFENLNVLFNISGACLSYGKNYSRLIFTKIADTEVLPNWKVEECKDCCFFSIEEKKEIIIDNKFCEKIVKTNGDFLEYKSGLYIDKPYVDAKFVIYFDVAKEILNIHKEAIGSEIENALELINLIENNLEFFKSYEHDTGRFVDNIRLNTNIASIIKNNGTLISKMLGGKIIINKETSELTDEQIRKNINNLFRLTQKAKIDPNIKIKKKINIKVGKVIKCFWPSLETILLNLMINTFLKTKTSDSKIIINLSIENNYLVLNYKQIGCMFDPSPVAVRQWLNGKYDKSNLCGFGHLIIQKTVDRFNGTLVIQLKKDNNVYTIKKDQPILEYKLNTKDYKQELCYIAHLAVIYKESK